MPERTVPNIYGVEMEYSAMLTLPGDEVYEIVGRCHSASEPLGLYVEPKSKGTEHIDHDSMVSAFEDMGIYSNTIGMLSNGGRFYIDPSGPEYDTPEVTSAEEAVHRSFDGDAIVSGMFARLRDQNVLEGFQLNRRIVDHTRTSRGVHLNTATSLPADRPTPEIEEALATLNVVKGSMFGSGGLLVDEDGKTAFHHSPRLSLTTHLGSNYSNYKDRPLVRYPFKQDGEELARVETVTSDALNFAWPFRASLVATNSLIRLIELNRSDTRIPELLDPITAAHIVGRYGSVHSIEVLREDGEYVGVKPHRILANFCEIMLETDVEEDFLDAEARQVLPEIIDVADIMDVDIEAAALDVESIARQLAMKKKMDQRGVKLSSETMCRFDYAWDWIGGGIAETLRSRDVGWRGFETKYSPRSAAKRRNIPPKDTRAQIRGKMIKDSDGDPGLEVYWTGTSKRYLHPLDTEL